MKPSKKSLKLPKLLSIEDILTKEERTKLREDLAIMAKQRRQAEAAARNLPMA